MKLIAKKTLREAVKLGDLLHTVNGGISQTMVRVEEQEKEAVICISAPGVSPESFMVMLHKNRLTIFSEYHDQNNAALRVPLFNRTWELPASVNLSKVAAEYQEGELQVHLPYHKGVGETRIIQIKHRD